MRRLPRWLLFVAFVLTLVLGALSSLAVVTMRESYPQTNGEITIPALSSSATIYRDEYGIPQIYADTPEDLFAAQGFIHAQDRFFEMDLRRHITAGRLSELFGPSQLTTDRYIRTLGWRRVAEQEASNLSGPTRRYLEAYAAGVNAWLQTPSQSRTGGDLSLEYAILGLSGGGDYQPEPWTVVDSLAWFKAMAWDLDGNRVDEIERALLTASMGAERTSEIFPAQLSSAAKPIVTRGAVVDGSFDPTAQVTVPAGVPPTAGGAATTATSTPVDLAAVSSVLTRTLGMDDALSGVLNDPRDRLGGSNSWVVSPELSLTGSPILSNDPHLAASVPSTFTQIGLHCTVKSATCPFDVVGFSFAGVPGVIIGHNADIAWGMTTPYVDTQDLFVERVRGAEVQRGTTWEAITTRTEQIRVKGQAEPVEMTVRQTRHGPLISDVDPDATSVTTGESPPPEGDYAVALSWTALQPGTTAEALFAINTATNFVTFREAAKKLTSPSQNLLYADRFGNIGYQLPGSIPIRTQGDGNLPRPGWDANWDWQGTIPFEQLPWEYNPPSGYIVAANQTVIGPQYQPHLGSGASYGWRSDMLEQRIAQQQPMDLTNAQALFTDTTMGFAADLVPALLRVRVTDDWVADGQRTLVGWDYQARANSAAAAYFSVVYDQVMQQAFADQLPPGVSMGGADRWQAVLRDLLQDPTNPWWDDVTTPEVETRDDILLQAMTDARKEITVRLSEDPSGWSWGKLHTVTLEHTTLGRSGIPALAALFNRGPVPVGGSTAVINAMSWRAGEGDYTVTNAPTMRMVVDFSAIDQSLWINQSGVSGHVTHENYDDQFPLWVQGQMIPMSASRTEVERRSVDKLQLLAVA